MSNNRASSSVNSLHSNPIAKNAPLEVPAPGYPKGFFRVNGKGPVMRRTTRKRVMPARKIIIRIPSTIEDTTEPTEEEVDPDLLTDAESEYRLENARQKRPLSPDSSSTGESRVGPVRDLAFPPPTIHNGTNLEVPPLLLGTMEGARRLNRLVADCSWNG